MNGGSAACPFIYGSGLTLEPLVAAHAPALFPLLADEELWRFEDERAPQSIGALANRYRLWETRCSPDGSERWLNWAVRVDKLGLIGVVQATVCDGDAEAWIAYMLGRTFWSAGYGTEAARLLVAHVRDTIGVTRAFAHVDERNAPSRRLLQKLGFELADARDSRNLLFALLLQSG